MAAWAHAQNGVRLGQAFHLNPGSAAQEQSQHAAVDDIYTCDLIFPRRNLATDTWATILAASVLAWLRPDDDVAGITSWADMHECVHDASGPCSPPTHRYPVG